MAVVVHIIRSCMLLLFVKLLMYMSFATICTSKEINTPGCELPGHDISNLTGTSFWYLDINDTEACSFALPANDTIDRCRVNFAICHPLPSSLSECFNCTAALTSDYDDQYDVDLGTYRNDVNPIETGINLFIFANGIGNITSYLSFECNNNIKWDYVDSTDGNKVPEAAYKGLFYNEYTDGIFVYIFEFEFAGVCEKSPTIGPPNPPLTIGPPNPPTIGPPNPPTIGPPNPPLTIGPPNPPTIGPPNPPTIGPPNPPTIGPPNPPSKQGLSTGSIMLIIVFPTLTAYFIAGIIFNKVRHNKKGKELIPDYAFWSSLPGLIYDGALFTWSILTCRSSGSKTISGYEDL
ncbi:uncharacterized protein [Antedon mediterranea]|uniref:uncharacterized protein n=1 Tax=Antedon mediterranea TaxID=105859 RepID=UPI003AF7CFE9